ncbi:uncharacterized protein LOC105645708 isoform X3 [Jatropha curcas]|uniref:uncharacterized protein LOC105645708 isoform X3 n=1 Tax=Jatropha curcas TaxID=180498 RepID=UPI0009D654EE|nr:uncharacterized protein LOC105645708 isoform X3 [Jatropha curcas]
MEQFRQIGEVLGSLKALMVLQDDIQINRRQCCLLLNIYTLAFKTIAEEMKQNLKLEEKNTKWKPLEGSLKELHRVFKEGELYVRRCLDSKDWWAKVVSLHQNNDSIEFHIHNLLTYFPVVIEAIETAGEISGLDQGEMQKKRVILSKKYDRSWNDSELFQLRFGKQYLVSREICSQLENAMKEDRWLLVEAIKEKLKSGLLTKNKQRLGDILQKKLNGQQLINGKLPSSSILLGAEDYQVRRRIGGGSKYKEIQWLGESFVLRHFFEDFEPLSTEISTLLSLSHPNILQYLCGFYDEEKKECFLVMELMSKDLYAYMKENSSSRRQVLFHLPIVVDIMLQVARGKLAFEDGHLQGEQMTKNIRAGERPLFPSLSPKYLVNLTKKCWHNEPSCRPSFSSICRVLRYVKKFLAMNPSNGQPVMQSPPLDYYELEAGFLKKHATGEMKCGVTQIPFQMFVYTVSEKEKTSLGIRFKHTETASEGDENISVVEDPVDTRSVGPDVKTVYFDVKSTCTDDTESKTPCDLRSVRSEPLEKKIMLRKKTNNVKLRKTSAGKAKAPTAVKASPQNSPSHNWRVMASPLSPKKQALGREKS